jgi:hypothetical protein
MNLCSCWATPAEAWATRERGRTAWPTIHYQNQYPYITKINILLKLVYYNYQRLRSRSIACMRWIARLVAAAVLHHHRDSISAPCLEMHQGNRASNRFGPDPLGVKDATVEQVVSLFYFICLLCASQLAFF